MSTVRRLAVLAAITASLALPLAAEGPIVDRLNPDTVYAIKTEGLQQSKVMEIASYLTDVYGPRLTGSPESTPSDRRSAGKREA